MHWMVRSDDCCLMHWGREHRCCKCYCDAGHLQQQRWWQEVGECSQALGRARAACGSCCCSHRQGRRHGARVVKVWIFAQAGRLSDAMHDQVAWLLSHAVVQGAGDALHVAR